jgi:polyhydroxybutyrate depolymerase
MIAFDQGIASVCGVVFTLKAMIRVKSGSLIMKRKVGRTVAIVSLLVTALSVVVTPAALSGGLRERLKERREARTSKDDVEKSIRINGPGDYRFSMNHDGLQRQYMVHVPRRYRGDQATPMLLALHGGGGNMDYMADDKNYGLISASEKAGYIVVFPNGISPVRSGMLATWNAGNCCGSARDKNIDDVGFLKAVVVRVSQQAKIDPRRIYSTGMSNGALMSYRLACETPGMIRGIMAVAGTDNTKSCTPKTPVAVLHIHARNDDHVLFDGGAGPAARDPSKVTDFISVPATIAKWVGLNRAATTPARVLTVAGAYCDLHAASANGAPVKLCVTDTGGHSWPGGTKTRASEPPSQAIIANDMMWAFFQSLS